MWENIFLWISCDSVCFQFCALVVIILVQRRKYINIYYKGLVLIATIRIVIV